MKGRQNGINYLRIVSVIAVELTTTPKLWLPISFGCIVFAADIASSRHSIYLRSWPNGKPNLNFFPVINHWNVYRKFKKHRLKFDSICFERKPFAEQNHKMYPQNSTAALSLASSWRKTVEQNVYTHFTSGTKNKM